MLHLERKKNTGFTLRDINHDYTINIKINKIKPQIVEIGIDAPECVTISRNDFMAMDAEKGASNCRNMTS